MKRNLLLLFVLLGSISLAVAQEYTKYLFVYFPSNDNENIYYALSDKETPFDFEPMNNGLMVISADTIALKKGVRDPHVLRGDDGWFYMVNTDMRCAEGWSSNRGIVLMRSRDLVSWQHSTVHFPDKYAGTNFANVTRVWAPETIWDPIAQKYMVYFSLLTNDNTIPYDKVYYCYANADFTDLEGEPTYLYDRGSATIDMDIVYNEEDHLYHGFYKNEGSGGICKVTASRLTAADGMEPGSQWSTPSGALQQTHVAVEGAGVWPLIDSNKWILMYDCYGSGYYQFCESTDLLNFSSCAQTNTSGMFTPRHGTVLPLTDAEVETLQRAFAGDLDRRTEAVSGASLTNPVETDFVINGKMNQGITGWFSTTGARNQQTATNQQGAFQGAFYENWNPSNFTGKMYQKLVNIPNGTYELRIAAFVQKLGNQGEQYVYANDDRQSLTSAAPTAYSVCTYVTDNTLEVGLCQTKAICAWMGLDCVSLIYYGADDQTEAVRQLVIDRQRASFEALLRATMTNAQRLGIDIAASETLLAKADLTEEEVEAEVIRLQQLEAAVVDAQYTLDLTDRLGTWSQQNVSNTMHGQHWDGTTSTTYYEQYSGWAGTSWSLSMTQTLTLSAGSYVFKVACRASSAVQATVAANDVVLDFPVKGDTGYGIATDGSLAFDAGSTYANSGLGRGWEWRFLPFTLAEGEQVTIAFTGQVTDAIHQWMSYASFSLLEKSADDTNGIHSCPDTPSTISTTTKALNGHSILIHTQNHTYTIHGTLCP